MVRRALISMTLLGLCCPAVARSYFNNGGPLKVSRGQKNFSPPLPGYTGPIILNQSPAGTGSYATGCSSNGTVIVGQAGAFDIAAWWDRDTGVVTLLNLLAPGELSIANGCSSDGSVIVGGANSVGDTSRQYDDAVYWTKATGVATILDQQAGSPAPPNSNSNATWCSADGTIIVGRALNSDNRTDGVWWLKATKAITALQTSGILLEETQANSCSADGTVIVGTDFPGPNGGNGGKACLWPRATGIIQLLNQAPNSTTAEANGCSGDGSVIVGYSKDSTSGFNTAAKWAKNSGILTSLSNLPGGTASSATKCSNDGSIIVGSADDNLGITRAVYWDSGGIHLLGQNSGTDFNEASAISADLSTIVGDSDILPGLNDCAVCWTNL